MVEMKGARSTRTTTAADKEEDSKQSSIDRHPDRQDDEDLIENANKHIKEECILAAARVLRLVKNEERLTTQHRQNLHVAQDMEESTTDLLQEPDSTWTKQSETKSNSSSRDTAIYYKVSEKAKLECRIDCVVESSLLVPLLSVLNETSLYATWIPSWSFPITLGIKESKQLQQVSRGHQIVHITANVPWPVAARDVVLRATAADDIAANKAIVVRMKGVDTDKRETHNDKDNTNIVVIPDPLDGIVRADFEGALLFRPCAAAAPAGEESTKVDTLTGTNDNDLPVHVSFKMFLDPHLTTIPASVLNFVTRVVIGTMWNMLLHVAEGVRAGKRPLHAKAIEERVDLYDWIKERINVLLGQNQE